LLFKRFEGRGEKKQKYIQKKKRNTKYDEGLRKLAKPATSPPRAEQTREELVE
jgi:hypothetical protein